MMSRFPALLALSVSLLVSASTQIASAAENVRAYIRLVTGHIVVIDTETDKRVATLEVPTGLNPGVFSAASLNVSNYYYLAQTSPTSTHVVKLNGQTHETTIIGGPPIGHPDLGTFASGMAIDETFGRLLVGSERYDVGIPPTIAPIDLQLDLNLINAGWYSDDLDGMAATPVAMNPQGTHLFVATSPRPKVVEINPPPTGGIAQVLTGFWYLTCSGDPLKYCNTDAECALVGAGDCNVGGLDGWLPGGAIANTSGNAFWATGQIFGAPGLLFEISATSAPIRHIEVGYQPTGLDITPDGTTIYVANSCGNGPTTFPCQSRGTVSVVDVASGAVTNTITVGHYPQPIAVEPDGEKVYVVNVCGEEPLRLTENYYADCSSTISVIDVATGTITKTIALSGESGVTAGTIGKFLATVPDMTTDEATVGTGTRWICLPNGGPVTGSTAFDNTSYDVFGTPVNLGMLLGALPVESGTLSPSPVGFDLTLASVSLSTGIDETGVLQCSPLVGCWSPLSTNRYSAMVDSIGPGLPAGVSYSLSSEAMNPATCPFSCPPSRCLAGPLTVHAAAPANTPTGLAVEVQGLVSAGALPISVTYQSVTNSGVTVVVPGTRTPSFALGIGNLPFDVSTSADFTGPIEVCVSFPHPAVFPDVPRILHLNSQTGRWEDITFNIDTIGRRICGLAPSLSPFAVIDQLPIGFVPSGGAPASCAAKALKAAAKLHGAIAKCHAGAAKAALKAAVFDEAECESKARTKYETAITRVSGCATCQSEAANALGGIVHAQADTLSGGPYCEGTTPLGDDESGYFPTSTVAEVCAKKLTYAAARLAQKILGCRTKAASAALKGKSFDRGVCEGGATTNYLKTTDKLGDCSTCVIANIGPVHDQALGIADHAFRALHCDGGSPLD
jgi:YVTN family beta-propeller protein